MKLNDSLEGLYTYKSLEGKTDLRFELFDWLKSKGLSVRQALDLMSLTGQAIRQARKAEINQITL